MGRCDNCGDEVADNGMLAFDGKTGAPRRLCRDCADDRPKHKMWPLALGLASVLIIGGIVLANTGTDAPVEKIDYRQQQELAQTRLESPPTESKPVATEASAAKPAKIDEPAKTPTQQATVTPVSLPETETPLDVTDPEVAALRNQPASPALSTTVQAGQYPPQLDSVIDRADWPRVQSALMFLVTNIDADRASWDSAQAGNGGEVTRLSSDGACTQYVVSIRTPRQDPDTAVSACQENGALEWR